MRAKKPQTRRTGGSLATPLNTTPKKQSATLIAQQRLLAASKRKAVIKKIKSSTTVASAPKASIANKSTANDAPATKGDASVTKKDAVGDKKPKTPLKSNVQNVVAAGKKETNAKRAVSSGKNTKTPNAKTKPTTAVAKKDEKTVKSSKELKNLDIQLCGFGESNSPGPDSGQTIKASISEIVKTKSRAATTSTPLHGNCATSPIPAATPTPKGASVGAKPTTSVVELKTVEHSGSKKDSLVTEKSDEKPKKPTVDKKKGSAKDAKPVAVENSVAKKASAKKIRVEKQLKLSVKPSAKKATPVAKKENNKKSKETPTTTDAESKPAKCSDEEVKIEKRPAPPVEASGKTKPTISIAKSIEIKTDESKSLIDTITDAINEVVKQYQDSAMCEANEPRSSTTSTKVTKQKVTGGKVAKAPRKKPLSKDTLSAIKGASENLAKEVEKMANVVKRPAVKRPPKKVSQVSVNGVKSSEAKNIAGEQSPPKADESTEKSDDKRKSQDDLQQSPQKTKKKVRAAITPKKGNVANVKKNDSSVAAPPKSETSKAADGPPPPTSEQKSDDDDNMSLTKLKATLSQGTVRSHKKIVPSRPTLKKQMKVVAVKSTLIAPKIKQKYLKKNKKNVATANKVTATCSMQKLKTDASSENMSTTAPVDRGVKATTKDIYDFHESGHSSEDALSCYKKKKELIVAGSFAEKRNTPLDASKSDGKSKASNQKGAKAPMAKKKEAPSPPKKVAKPLPIGKAESSGQSVAGLRKDDDEESHVSSDNSDSSYSDGENERQKKRLKKRQKKRQQADASNTSQSKRKPASRSASSNASSDAEDDADESDADEAKKSADSDTSVKTRVNNRRKLAAKNRRMKLYGFYSGPKRHRMASLNALAKVQCLYENESRTAQELGFVKEPRIVPKEVRLLPDGPSTSAQGETVVGTKPEPPDPKKDKRSKIDTSEPAPRADEEKEEVTSNRTLRNVPGLRGAGLLWEMEESSMDDESEAEDKQVSPLSTSYILD